MARFIICLQVLGLIQWTCSQTITFDNTKGYGRQFDGIGGLSSGASSKLLMTYPEKYRDEILDYLFKPNFGASLQILKVEIGGDTQSTDGSEASHMHYSWEENYDRGYEWWLMKEAKKRNPEIKLYALPWGFPAWIGQGTGDAYHDVEQLADYVVRWVNGARVKHDLVIDYIGIWNQKPYNVTYIKTLRKTLDQRGFNNTQIIAADWKWNHIIASVAKDKDLQKIVYAIGSHYPGTYSPIKGQQLGNRLWASEDYCQKNTEVGGACWARVTTRNYVHGYMTATIAWTLIASFYTNLPGWDMGLMTAKEPWNGHYVVASPIWTTAHTTQFTSIGWNYLQHGHGVGTLPQGGTYVSLVNPGRDQLTIVLETMTFEHSQCVWDPKIPFTVKPQLVNLSLEGKFKSIKEMNMWLTELRFDGNENTLFEKLQNPLKFHNGRAWIFLDLNQMVTLTTLDTGNKGAYSTPPPHVPFPLPYTDNFDAYSESQEPNYLSQQTGSFEILKEGSNGFVRQMVQDMTIPWCASAESINRAYGVFGDHSWTDLTVDVDFRIPTVNGSSGVFIAARATHGGCSTAFTQGIFFFALQDKFVISRDNKRTKILHTGDLSYKAGTWYHLSLTVKGRSAVATFDRKVIYEGSLPASPKAGWAALGTDNYGLADFDNLQLTSP